MAAKTLKVAAVLLLASVAGFLVTIGAGRDKCQPVPENTILDTSSAYKDRHAAFPIKSVRANGLNISYIEAGEGPLVILAHGFPDNARTWEEIMPRLAAAGFHAVAMFDRGYYPTDLAPDNDYSVASAADDVLALITALGEKKASLIGQDWGAAIVYAAANRNPDMVRKVVAVAIPPNRLLHPEVKIFRCFPHFLDLQFGPLSRWYASRNDFAYLEHLYHYWSPSWSVPKDQLDEVKADFSKPGRLGAALGYYHSALFDNFNMERTGLYNAVSAVPTLVFIGEEDMTYGLGMFDGIETAFTGSFETVLVPRAGHFLHREQPELFAQKTIEFLKK